MNLATITAATPLLIVDDEQNFLALLRWFLSSRGFAVETASCAEEALELLESKSFDYALVDIRMGPMDGLALLDELKRRLPNMHVIIMTAYPHVGVIKQSFAKGASGFLTKPVNLQELIDTLRSLP